MRTARRHSSLVLVLFLVACGGPVTPPPPPPPPDEAQSSYQLIDEALADGEIDDETALAYKVFATFGDDRLPERFVGDDVGRDGTLLMAELSRRIDELTPTTRAELEPFLLPPPAPGSWFQSQSGVLSPQQVTWGTLTTRNDKVKVWWQTRYPEDAARAEKYVNALNDRIWGSLTGLLREPLPDCGAACPQGGGDTRIDIYLVNVGRSAVTGASSTGASSAFMLLDPADSFAVLAHEFMHVIQYAYPMASDDEYDWLFESTAQWAMDFVYPTSNGDADHPATHEEQEAAGAFLLAPEKSLEFVNDDHEYGAYVFPFYLAGAGKDGAAVRVIWERATMPSSLAAINAAVMDRGGLVDVWPRFVAHNWNAEPVDDYRSWDQLMVGAPAKVNFVVGAPGKDRLESNVPHLAAFYYHFEFTTEQVRSVVIENPYASGGDQHAHVQVVAKIGGQWREPEDITRAERKRYCRERPEEHVEELLLMVSNSAWQDRNHKLSGGDIVVDAKEAGCTCDALDGVTQWAGTGGFSFDTVADDGVNKLELSVSADVSSEFAATITGGAGTALGNTSIDKTLSGYDSQGVLHFLSSVVGSGAPVPAPVQGDTSTLVLVLDPAACRYTMGVRTYVNAVATDIQGETTEVVATVGSFSTAWRPIPDDLHLTGGGGFRVHSSQFILGQDDLIDAFLFDDFYLKSILGEDGMGTASVSWDLAPVPPPP